MGVYDGFRFGGVSATSGGGGSSWTAPASGISAYGAFGNIGGGSSSQPVSTWNSPDAVAARAYAEQQRIAADPWTLHRKDAGTLLASQMGNDPTKPFTDKLTAMANGVFSPSDPSYQWRLSQGQQSVERSLASRGMLDSGAGAIELQQYGQGAASQEYGAQFQRMLQGLQGVSNAHDQTMQQLMKMAGVNVDSVGAAKLGLDAFTAQSNASTNQQNADTNATQVANNYNLGQQTQNLNVAKNNTMNQQAADQQAGIRDALAQQQAAQQALFDQQPGGSDYSGTYNGMLYQHGQVLGSAPTDPYWSGSTNYWE